MSQSSIELITPLDIDKAEYVLSLSEKNNNIFKHMMVGMREIESQLENRKKQIRIFNQIYIAAEKSYTAKLSTHKQYLSTIADSISDNTNELAHLNNKRDALVQEAEVIELELNDVRDYAEQRRNKKSKREKQYHQLYHVPIVASQLKKKYVRARDKNSVAEEKVSEARASVDSLQKTISDMSKTIGDLMREVEGSRKEYEELDNEVNATESILNQLKQGDAFWTQFETHQFMHASQAVDAFISTLQKHSKSNSHLKKVLNPENDIVKVFKLALLDYGEAVTYGESRWTNLQLDYNCAKCLQSYCGWPRPDKVRPSDMLCEVCYRETHSAMVWEKKMSHLSLKLTKERPGQLSLPSTSRLSISSSSTAVSSSSSIDSHRSGLKKVVQLFKKTTK